MKSSEYDADTEAEDDEDESVSATGFVPREFIDRFLEEFQHYSEHFPRRLSGFFEDYDACGELLSSEERQTLRNQVVSMMNVLAALDEKIQSRESKDKDATKVVV